MNLDAALDVLARQPGAPLDLAELALRLDRDEYPHLDVEAYLGEIDAMAHEARAYLRGDLSSKVGGLCRYLFHDRGFRGNTNDYYDPQNSYLHQVLDRHTGIPISLSAVVMAVAARAGLPVAGVGLPGHFIVKAVEGDQEILFDPFHGGRRLSLQDCEHLVHQVTGADFPVTAATLQGISLGTMVHRMLNNLKAIYLRREDYPRVLRVLHRLRQLDPENPVQQRDLGMTFMRLSYPGRAIDHLAAYLEKAPAAGDADVVRQLLRTARRQVAAWN
jgi:regulator of sirC expression with transglutaminase-like and TPR domain